MNPNYTIVIPAYNCAHELRQLIADIQINCQKYKPKSILIVNDCSIDDDTKYIANIYTSSELSIKCLQMPEHLGPLHTEQAGLDAVNTDYAIVLHSDTRLSSNSKVNNVYSDVLSLLACYIDKTPDAIAVSAFSLCIENPKKIRNGPRSLGIDGLPYSYYREFNFATLRRVRFYDWKEVFSIDSDIYALRMKYYHEIKFDERFAPYLYYHDDFFARARLKGYRTYLTQDAVAFHPRFANKPEGSLAIINDELYTRNLRLFKDKWQDKFAWSEESFNIKVISRREIE